MLAQKAGPGQAELAEPIADVLKDFFRSNTWLSCVVLNVMRFKTRSYKAHALRIVLSSCTKQWRYASLRFVCCQVGIFGFDGFGNRRQERSCSAKNETATVQLQLRRLAAPPATILPLHPPRPPCQLTPSDSTTNANSTTARPRKMSRSQCWQTTSGSRKSS